MFVSYVLRPAGIVVYQMLDLACVGSARCRRPSRLLFLSSLIWLFQGGHQLNRPDSSSVIHTYIHVPLSLGFFEGRGHYGGKKIRHSVALVCLCLAAVSGHRTRTGQEIFHKKWMASLSYVYCL